MRILLSKTIKSTSIALVSEIKCIQTKYIWMFYQFSILTKIQYKIVCPVIGSVSTNEFDLDVELNLNFECLKISNLFGSNRIESEYSCRSNWKVENISVNFFLLESSLKSNHWRNVAYFIEKILAYCCHSTQSGQKLIWLWIKSNNTIPKKDMTKTNFQNVMNTIFTAPVNYLILSEISPNVVH